MIHLFCALHCEAEPIINYFKLTELKQHKLFRLYQSEDNEISLIITGIGKLNAASAVSYQHASINTSVSDIWLNIGVAGHKEIPIGDARLIHKIIDAESKACWYPQILFKSPCDTATLTTLAQSSTDYQDSLFDMEAAGFYDMAIRLGTAELIHSMKIVSDNPKEPASIVNKDKVKKYIAGHVGTLNKVIDNLVSLSSELESATCEPEYFQNITEQCHFTQSEKIQLSSLLRQCSIRLPDLDVSQTISGKISGKDILTELRMCLNKSDFVIYD